MTRKAKHAEERLEKPAGKVIQRRAENLLEKVDSAVLRLRDADDAEALHDARVALRRLRSWFQAFRKELHLKGKQKRELQRLAHSTNTARDAEVGLEWLSARRPRGNGRSAAGTIRFAADLRALREESYSTVRQKLPPAWHKLSRKLARVAKHADKAKAPFRKAFDRSLKDYGRNFEQARLTARRGATAPDIHALRIAGKKLRYLADNALGKAPVAERFLREMNALHDSAGKIQDLQRLLALSEDAFLRQTDGRFRHLLLSSASRRPSLTPVLYPFLQLGRTAAREQAQRIVRFREVYLGNRQPDCLRELQRMRRHLDFLRKDLI